MLGPRDPQGALIWTLSVLVSILVHEFGHGLMARFFGHDFEVTLHGMGGLCTYDSSRDGAGKRIAVLAAGPGAQLVFLAILCAVFSFWLNLPLGSHLALAQLYLGLQPSDPGALFSLMNAGRQNVTGFEAYQSLFQINLLWPLLNLLPIWPLDGGQIACESLAHVNPRDGRRWGHIVSLLTAGLLIIYIFYSSQHEGASPGDQSLFRIIYLAFFGYMNYQVLQSYHAQYRAYGPDNDGDWR